MEFGGFDDSTCKGVVHSLKAVCAALVAFEKGGVFQFLAEILNLSRAQRLAPVIRG